MSCTVVRVAAEEICFPWGQNANAFAVKSGKTFPATAAGTVSDQRHTFDQNTVGLCPVAVVGPDMGTILAFMRDMTTTRVRIGPTFGDDWPWNINCGWQDFRESGRAVRVYHARHAAMDHVRSKVARTAVAAVGGAMAKAYSSLQKLKTTGRAASNWHQKGTARKNAALGLMMSYFPLDDLNSPLDTGRASITFSEIAELYAPKIAVLSSSIEDES